MSKTFYWWAFGMGMTVFWMLVLLTPILEARQTPTSCIDHLMYKLDRRSNSWVVLDPIQACIPADIKPIKPAEKSVPQKKTAVAI